MTIHAPRRAWSAVAALTLAAALRLAIPASQAPARAGEADPADAFQARVLPLLERYCIECHTADDASGGVSLDGFDTQAEALKDGKTWLRVRDAIEGGAMPPAEAAQPSLAERERVVAWVEDDYLAARCGEGRRAAPVAIRRLNRQEYNNTIRDLLGLDLRLADGFPQDDIGHGFDNVGSALNLSPVLVEKYLDAAEVALDRAIVVPDAESYAPAELIGLKTYPLPADAPVEFKHTMKPGRYLAEFSLVRVGIAESVPPPRLVIGFGSDRRTVDAVRVQDETVVYRYWLDVAAGDSVVSVALAPGQANGPNVARPTEVGANVSGDQRYGGRRGLHVDSMVVRGPVPRMGPEGPASHRRIFFIEPGYGDEARLDAARRIIDRFAARAFRRPVRPDEIDRLLRIYRLAHDRGECHERAVQVALTTVLASPGFLFLVEPGESKEDRPLDAYELASRLSYFLWSSMPDEACFTAAREGTLRPDLRRHVARMLDDPKSSALVENFTGQWLGLRRLAGVTPDRNLFPEFNDSLRAAMKGETEQYFGSILRDDRSILDLLDSDYTYLNETLARHYGIEGVRGESFRKVRLADRRRGGVLTQASILTLTSNPNRTSPVKRGQWILQQILGTPPPPPPPEVAKLDDSKAANDASTLRERMQLHRADPKCASCHRQMDPLGFALENFDAVGRWRTKDGEFPVDASGELAGGRKFAGAGELKGLLATTGVKKFSRSLIKNMLTYALGRGLDVDDACTVEEIRKALAADGYRARAIVFGIVESPAFGFRGVGR